MEQISADALIDSLPLEAAWPVGMDVEAAAQALAIQMAAQGKEIVGNLRAAYFEKLEEAATSDQELTREQQDFFEEEAASRNNNPLYQKPKPY